MTPGCLTEHTTDYIHRTPINSNIPAPSALENSTSYAVPQQRPMSMAQRKSQQGNCCSEQHASKVHAQVGAGPAVAFPRASAPLMLLPVLPRHPVTRLQDRGRDRRRTSGVRIRRRGKSDRADVLLRCQEHERERRCWDGDQTGVGARVARYRHDAQVALEAPVNFMHRTQSLNG